MSEKSINQFPLVNDNDPDDLILLQRGDDYKSITVEKLNNGIIKATLNLTSAEILALNGTPIEFVAAQGAGTYLRPVTCETINNFNAAAYVSGNSLRMKYVGDAEANYLMTTDTAFLTAASTEAQYMVQNSTKRTMDENTGVELFVNTADPTAGDGTITAVALFRVVTF